MSHLVGLLAHIVSHTLNVQHKTINLFDLVINAEISAVTLFKEMCTKISK